MLFKELKNAITKRVMPVKSLRDEEKARLKALGPVITHYPFPEIHGVLLKDKIEAYQDACGIFDDGYCSDHVGVASYSIRVGRRFKSDGDVFELGDGAGGTKRCVEIPPFGVVQIETMESLNLPAFLIARWNIKVSLANKGLVWVGAPQVDPGWCGRLSPPIYNLSKNAVRLLLGESFATMDFVKTTPFPQNVDPKEKDRLLYPRPNSGKIILHQYHDLASGLQDLKEGVEVQKDQVKRLVGQVGLLTALNLGVLSILIGAGVFSAFEGDPKFKDHFPNMTYIVIVVALLFVIFFLLNWVRATKRRR